MTASPTPEARVGEVMRKAVIQHGGTEKQMEFWNSNHKWRAFVGGVGSGKTRAGVVELLRMPPGTNGMIVAPTYKMLADPTMETFHEVIPPELIVSHNKTDKKIKLCDGKTILYRSADDPESLRGPNLGWVWMDEAALMEEYAWKIIVGRLRRKPGRAWITTTPKGYDWIWERFEDQPSELVPDPQNYHLVRCSSDANVFLPDDYIDALVSTYSGAFADQEIGGEFTEWGKSKAYEFKRTLNCQRGLRDFYRKDEPLILCCDFNYLVKPWPIIQKHKGRPMVIDEVVVHGDSVTAAANEFRDKFPDHRHDLIIYGDASGRSKGQTAKTDYQLIIEAMEGYSAPIVLRVQKQNPAPRDRINSLNRLLKGNPEKGIPVLKIDEEHCPFLIRDLTQCHWNKAGTDVEKVTDPEKREAELTHATDAIGYWAWREFPFVKPNLKEAKKRAKARGDWKEHNWDEHAAGGVA